MTDIATGRVLRGTLRIPGDKSVSHRALILAALADGTSTIDGLSAGLDVAHTRAIVEALGARITEAPDATSPHRVGTLTVHGGHLHAADHDLDVGNSGTGIRLLAGLCAGLPFRSVLTGDASIAQRPMDRVTIPLRQMGARIDGRDGGRLAPLEIHGGDLRGIDYTPPVASAQVKSAILLAGLHAEGQTVVREPIPTRRHTEEMLRDRGVTVVTEPAPDGGDVITLTPGPVQPGPIVVPGDPSQSAFWICAAAAIPGSDLTVEGLYLAPERTGFLPVLQRMGADLDIDRAAGSVHVLGTALRGTVITAEELPDLIDEVPALAVAAALTAEGTLDIQGAAELRTKESDRIDTVAAMLRALGGRVDTEPERLVVHAGATLHPGTVESHGDHRIAMAAAVVALGIRDDTAQPVQHHRLGLRRDQLSRLSGRSRPRRRTTSGRIGRTMTELPTRAQVVIVGGGVIGCSIAYHLSDLGVTDVVLIERDELTAGTTWHAAGLITSAGMVDETSIFMARYSRDLYSRLEEETGHSTGFREIGHLHLACTPQRLEALRRERAFQRGFGIDNVEVSAAEVAELSPVTMVDDILAASYVADEGRADPVGVATALSKGARARGVTIVSGVTVTGLTTEGRRVTAVTTDQGDVECETVVLAAGLWTRELARRNGIDVPLQAAEHYYLLTEPIEGVHRDLPVIEDPDRYAYYREEGSGLLVGLFEPVGAPWHLDSPPSDFAFGTIPPDWDRMTPFLDAAMQRYPALADAGLRTFFCGPESFTPDLHPMLGPAPEVAGVYVAAGLNSLGILLGGGVGSVVAQWIVDGRAPVDVTHYSVERASPHETTRRFRGERLVESLGVLFGDGAWPTFQWKTGRNIRRSVIHDRLAGLGARFGQSAGWEYPLWFAGPDAPEPDGVEPTFGRAASFDTVGEEHAAVREAVGVMDMSLMSNFSVEGPDALRLLNRLSTSDIDVAIGRVVYTQWCDVDGGILADLTVTRLAEDRFLVVASDVSHRRTERMLREGLQPGEVAVTTDVTAGTTLLTVQGPRSRELLQSLSPDDWSDEALPYLHGREMEVGNSRVLALRVTYLGELGYELHIPSDQGVSVWDALAEAGPAYGLRQVGLLAMGSLRLEKGYRDYGLDIENTDDPITAGLGFTISWDKPDGFVGRDALLAKRDDRTSRMVQVLLKDPEPLLYGGEPVLLDGQWIGYVRAGAYGYTLGASVGLAVVDHEGGVTKDWLASNTFEVDIAGQTYPAMLSLRPLYDPDRKRILG